MLLPANVVADYYSKVPGASRNISIGGYVFPCETVLPSFTTIIGDYRAVTPAEHINYQPIRPGSPTCFGGIQASANARFSIFGAVFLKSQFAVFDSQGPRLGFAPQA
jgi:aspergillopepsin I